MISEYISYKLINNSLVNNVVSKPDYILFNYPGNSANISGEYEVNLSSGYYTIECWGAQGSNRGYNDRGGFGAYVRGTIFFQQSITLYLYIGAFPGYGIENTYNGGGDGDYPGGGASDIRLINGAWNNINSLISRIMVAGGGGGLDCPVENFAGSGGGIHGIHGNGTQAGYGAQQNSGGNGHYQGSFGKGGGGVMYGTLGQRLDNGGGGGGGYYGGGSGTAANACSGGGGSSFISGHPNCLSIQHNISIIHNNHPYHYSNLVFHNTEMIEGFTTMPLTNGELGLGNMGNGHIKISPILHHPLLHYLITFKEQCISISLSSIILSFIFVLL